MKFPDRINKLRTIIDSEIVKIFEGRRPDSLYRPMYHLLSSGGKRIRPILLILSCRAVGGRLNECINAALAVEFLHTFTLVHDDIMDQDDLRRGKPTVHKKWDEATAILAGDGLVTLAYETLLKTDHLSLHEVLKQFTDGLLVLCEGQALDKEFETRLEVLPEEYESMVEKKTAKLIQMCCDIGVLLGNGSEVEREAIGKFSFNIGKAFQIQDDILDLRVDEKTSGKPMGSDLLQKKHTYLTTHFLNRCSNSDKERFIELWNRSPKGMDEIAEFIKLFERTKSFRAGNERVRELIGDAIKSLDRLSESDSKEDLKGFALQIEKRSY